MTCKEMGGWCDHEVQGATWEEMNANGMKHMQEAHPEEAAKIMAMSAEDMKGWEEKTKPVFDAKLAAMASSEGADMYTA